MQARHNRLDQTRDGKYRIEENSHRYLHTECEWHLVIGVERQLSSSNVREGVEKCECEKMNLFESYETADSERLFLLLSFRFFHLLTKYSFFECDSR